MSGLLAARRGRRIALVGLALALGAGAHRAPAAEPDPPPWRVLILCGADIHVPAVAALVEAVRSALTDGAEPRLVTFQSEVVDSLSFDSTDHEAELLALLEKKYRVGRFDLVMPMADAPLHFTERHGELLWPGVPSVGFALSEGALWEDGFVAANETGVAMGFDEAGTLRLARRLQPDAERLLLVAGDSEYDRLWWPRLQEAATREGDGLQVETLFGLPIPAVLDRVSRLPGRSIVLYTSIGRDVDGLPVTPAIVAEQLSRASVAPVYGIWESQLGRGIVGGSMESLAAHGQRAGEVALRVLRGTPPDEIAVAPPAAPVPIVDWRQMRRFGLSEAALPPGSEVRYRPSSFVKEHPGFLAAVGLTLAIQTGLIVALLVQGRRRRRAEAEASRQRAALAHAARLSAVGELTASIAHEINQPLAAILSNAEAAELFLDADPPHLGRARRILRDIREEDQRASDVIRQVRRLSRKQPPELKPLSMNAVVADVLPLVEADARHREAEVEVDYGAGLPEVSGDPTQLRQVVLNLALNGLEALGPEGAGARRVRIRTRRADAEVELAVSDTGPGLTTEDLPRLFESFFTTKPEGLGLGLSIVRSIAEAHGGRVAAENDARGGATFRVRLPALQARAPGREEE